jgi:hypothetical protein
MVDANLVFYMVQQLFFELCIYFYMHASFRSTPHGSYLSRVQSHKFSLPLARAMSYRRG